MRRFENQPLLSPSDLNDLLECRHLMALKLARFEGKPGPNPTHGAHTEILVRYGEQHERAILDAFKNDGRTIERIETGRSEGELRNARDQTLDAMRRGVEVIHQAALVGGGIGGYADFLERIEQPSELGAWSYGVSDAKLARTVKTYFLVQLSAYAALIGQLQGEPPADLAVLLGDGRRDSYRSADFAAYVRAILQHAMRTIDEGLADTYPLPCNHCAICGYRHACEKRRRDDDHLSLVAGLRRDQVARLETAGVPTLAALAELADDTKVPRVPRDTLAKLRRQAALQLHERTTGEQVYELLPYQEGYGFGLLPAPAAGDLFFDIEGDPYIGDKGLEYLFGVGWLDEHGAEQFRAFWAHDREEERRSFEQLVDFFMVWRVKHHGCHIYHYASYEEQALKNLAMYHGTREDEIDTLLRGGTLVDLYRVVRQGVRISKDSYSLKRVEEFYWHEREAKVKEAGGSIVAYERWLLDGEQAELDEIELYNSEDVHSTRALREWLLGLREELIAGGAEVEWRPGPSEEDEAAEAEPADPETTVLRARLQQTGDEHDHLLGELLLYHRRESKPAWWLHFERLKKSEEELRDEDDEAIAGLEPDGPEGTIQRSRLVPLTFPPQQFKLAPGLVFDPISERGLEMIEMDAEQGTLTLKLGPIWQGATPRSLIPRKPYNTNEQRAALRRLAESVLDQDRRLSACEALLRGDRPAVGAAAQLMEGEFLVERAVALALALQGGVLPIQGPPGTGKTYTGAHIAVALMAKRRRVGVTAPSHKAIHNLLEEIERVARKEGVLFRGFKRGDGVNAYASPFGDTGSIENVDNDACEAAPEDVLLLAGTSWLFARDGLEGRIDTLLIDEAGQVSLADALAVGTSARNLVLLGDPQQLSQVAQGAHPEQTKVSALGHVLGEDMTMPAQRGLFIDVSRRMHPDVCRFVSEISYGGELHSLAECENQCVNSDGMSGAGLRAFLVEHAGNRRDSVEEALVIADQVALLEGGSVTLADGSISSIRDAGVMVVTPYNSQVRLLRERLPAWVDVGTVDKFQGREAAVVFFSMATSSGEDMPRNVDFLYSRNRLNVAVSRAKCLAVLVASPALLTIRCKTVEQMRLVNALCRFVEMADARA
jgi:predicted RecB family nuclease